jgi:hypothetical protein
MYPVNFPFCALWACANEADFYCYGKIDVLTWGYMRDLMLTVKFAKLNVINSGSVVIKIDAKVCFPRGPAGCNI